ncbi:MAG: hypothetical protein QOD81_3392 [Solirubrobacteraceae bacterium]|nr:hypothetical protein [Solirubrobacteraceae bacterium]
MTARTDLPIRRNTVLLAANSATLQLSAAAGDMYPPARRARGVALVLFGAVFGAILGPLVFSPLLAGRDFAGGAPAPLWLAGGAFMLVALVLVLCVRPDPRRMSFVAATAELADSTHAWERGKLLGCNDLLSGLTGAGLALVGGVALSALGVAALAIGGAALVIAPAVWILRETVPVPVAVRRT